jgi:hypothetical protein
MDEEQRGEKLAEIEDIEKHGALARLIKLAVAGSDRVTTSRVGSYDTSA